MACKLTINNVLLMLSLVHFCYTCMHDTRIEDCFQYLDHSYHSYESSPKSNNKKYSKSPPLHKKTETTMKQ